MKIEYDYMEISEEFDIMRTKGYTSDLFDEDIINASFKIKELDRLTLTDIQITSKSQCDGLIKLLSNSKESFKY